MPWISRGGIFAGPERRVHERRRREKSLHLLGERAVGLRRGREGHALRLAGPGSGRVQASRDRPLAAWALCNRKAFRAVDARPFRLGSFVPGLFASRPLLGEEESLLVTNGYGAFLARADLLFCHGSMRGLRRAVKGRRTLLWTSEELLELVAGRRAHRVVAVSHKAAAEWRSLYGTPGDRLRVLANCVDATAFTPDGATRRRDGELRVLFVGRLELRKGPDRLSALADHAADAAPDLRLTIASPNAAGIGAFARRPNVRVLTGLNFKELPELYREHDVHYLPSRYELRDGDSRGSCLGYARRRAQRRRHGRAFEGRLPGRYDRAGRRCCGHPESLAKSCT